MNVFQIILLNSIYLIFPLILYLLYQVYSKTLNKEKNELYLDIALISSFYLITQYGNKELGFITLLLANIPIIIAYMKKRYLSIFLLSLMTIIYYYEYLNFPIIGLTIEYIFYFIIYSVFSKKQKSDSQKLLVFFIIKGLFFILYIVFCTLTNSSELLLLTISLFIFYLETLIVIYLFKKTEDILKLHKTIDELQKEKQIRESLFKITHEIKNPIAVCKGYLDMFDTNKLEHSRKYIPIIKSEIERVLILLKDFLSITKIKVELDIIDINLLLENVINSFLPLITDRKIKIKSNITDEELYIMADYNRLSQVFVNIIKNSIEALEEIDDGQINISIIEKKNHIIVKIIDNGSGIDGENLKRINEPFFTTKTNGTGLGIYLSNEIIRAHNGEINYTSNETGTTVTITLPNKKGY